VAGTVSAGITESAPSTPGAVEKPSVRSTRDVHARLGLREEPEPILEGSSAQLATRGCRYRTIGGNALQLLPRESTCQATLARTTTPSACASPPVRFDILVDHRIEGRSSEHPVCEAVHHDDPNPQLRCRRATAFAEHCLASGRVAGEFTQGSGKLRIDGLVSAAENATLPARPAGEGLALRPAPWNENHWLLTIDPDRFPTSRATTTVT
jgi:hypothetical protein